MGLRIERDKKSKAITGVSVIPELPELLSADEALLTVIIDPSAENLLSAARHSDTRVRWAVALHPKLTVGAARRLAVDATEDVKRALASNPATPSDVLEDLGQAEDLAVANAALRALLARERGTRA